MKYDASIQSHLSLLQKCIEASTGPVLEVGTGYFSTLFLHEFLDKKNRELVSIEDNDTFLEELKTKLPEEEWHHYFSGLDKCKDWLKWSVVLIDNAPGTQRAKDLAQFTDAEFVVIHDTEPESRHHYPDLETRMSEFKFRFDNEQTIWATVVSNTIDVNELMNNG